MSDASIDGATLPDRQVDAWEKTGPRIKSISAEDLSTLAQRLRERYGDGPPDPEDLAQEAYRRTLERKDASAIFNVKGYLWRTARNLIFDTNKSNTVRSKYDFEVEQLFFPLKGNNCSPETVLLA